MPHFRESQARPITNTEAIGCCLSGVNRGCRTVADAGMATRVPSLIALFPALASAFKDKYSAVVVRPLASYRVCLCLNVGFPVRNDRFGAFSR